MSFHNAFTRPLAMIPEARSICRHFSSRSAHLRAQTEYPYQNSAADSLLALDVKSPRHDERIDMISGYLTEFEKRSGPKQALESGDRQARAKDLQKMQARKWKAGDVYAPHDLSPAEMKKWRSRSRPDRDVFDILAINPMDHYMNYAMMSEFMTTMGRIKNPRDTGLRRVNQRKIAKAIRRSIGMGWMPSVHMHPEMLRRGTR